MPGPVAARAHRVAFNCFERVARQYAVDVSDLWDRKEVPVVHSFNPGPMSGVPVPQPSTTIPVVSMYGNYGNPAGDGHGPPSDSPEFHKNYFISE